MNEPKEVLEGAVAMRASEGVFDEPEESIVDEWPLGNQWL